jgi:hypothetical protein
MNGTQRCSDDKVILAKYPERMIKVKMEAEAKSKCGRAFTDAI